MRFNETEYSSPGQLDFVPRERRHEIWKTILVFSVTLAAIFVFGLTPDTVGGALHAALISMGVVMVLCFYIVYGKQRNLDLVMATEYQNMLFAQVAALGASFCLFVKRDGTIVYANDGLRKLFPHFAYGDSQALEGVFEQGGVQKPDRERIFAAIETSHSDRIVFPLQIPTGETKDYILTVEPLRRPGGFMVIRGREYRDQRAGVQLLPDMLRTTSIDKLDHLLATTPIAHYVTDAFGRLEYVTPALEQILGYAPGDMLGGKLGLQHMLYQLHGQPLGKDYAPSDYSGMALLSKRPGGVVSVILDQNLIRNAQGKVMGATGTALPHDSGR